MRKSISFGIKFKTLLIIIPILVCSFTVSSYFSIISSKKNLFDLSTQFMSYKLEQLELYTFSQWQNLKISGLAENPIYLETVQKSIESFAQGMIRKDSEYIFILDKEGNLKFTTNDLNYTQDQWKDIKSFIPVNDSTLFEFSLSGEKYTGLTTAEPHFGWNFFIAEKTKSFLSTITKIIFQQSLAFGTALIIIIIGMIVSIRFIISPIQRISRAINNISKYKDFSQKIKIEYNDEIGELAFEFNNMTTNLDLAYKKLKKYALDEASANKEVYAREHETIEILGKASDYKDQETGAHISRVRSYSLVLSKMYGHSEEMQDLIYKSAPLHDIGKLGIPDSILLKPGKLTFEEFETIKTHTTMGYEILANSSSKYLKAGAVIAISHHEKYDGSGYPRGLEGEEIPIFGRIVSLADVFDALVSKRPYKAPWPIEKTIDYIMKEKGKHFDPNLVELFIENFSDFEKIQRTIRDE